MKTQRRNPLAETRPLQIPDLYTNLRVAEKRSRNRQWEKARQSQKAMYRGVNPQLALQVKQIAGNLLVPTGEVARALLEYALRAYAEGDLELHPRPNPLRWRMTLYPDQEHSAQRHKPSSPPPRKKPLETKESWRVLVTWRGIPPELKQQIAALASEEGLNVPTGELVTALLRFSLKAYEYGLLKLEPLEKITGFSLYEGVS